MHAIISNNNRKEGFYMNKKIKRTSRYLAVLMSLMLLLSLCGCQQNNQSMKEDLESLGQSNASGEAKKETVNKLREELHIPEELQIDALSDDGKRGYQVNCKIDVPIEGNPSVYQQKQRSFTKEEIIKKAQKLFDSGEYSYVKPLDCYTMEELNEESANVQKVIDNGNTKDTDYYWHRRGDVAIYEEFFKKSEVKEYKEGDFTEGARVASYDKIMIMEGRIGGETYDLLAFTSNGHNYIELCKQDIGYDLTNMSSYFGYSHKEELSDAMQAKENSSVTQVIGDEEDEEACIYRSLMNEVEPTQTIRNQYGENQCKLSEEEAAKLALQYAALFGDADMVIAKTNWGMEHSFAPLSDTDEDGSLMEGVNSYIFYLQPQYGELTCNESNFWWREATDMNKETAAKADPSGIVAEQQNYRVKVTDKGVVSIDTIEPWYEIAETLSESTSLMDFNDVEELAKGYLNEAVKGFKTDKNTEKSITRISEVALRYATVVYDEEYTLIPCWFFNQSNGTWGGMSTVMVINAIDGSKVYLHGDGLSDN